jgi:nucleoside-diphosphate-sugar epimerase
VVAGEVFNVGGDALNHRIADIGDLVASVVQGVEVVRQGDVTDARDYRVSFEKIRRALDFVPAISVLDGIEEVAAAVRRDPGLRHHQQPVFHNVHALRGRVDTHAHAHAPELAGG